MERRQNRLPEWTRMIWASEKAKTTWEPRIQRIGVLLQELEIATVEAGNRQAAWGFVTPEKLPDRALQLAKRGLTMLPLQRVGLMGSYSSQGLAYQDGQPWHYRVLIVRNGDDDTEELVEQFGSGNNAAMGTALGYPDCCRTFFERVWVTEKWLDTTWPMAEVTCEARGSGVQTLRFEVTDRWPANILGRWASVRAVPWLPCSLACVATTAAWGKDWEPLAGGIDAEALEWLETLLRASWKWSALHGIAQIETSIFKVSTRTDACDELHAVEYVGDHELEAGAQGTRFPYHEPQAPQLTKGKSFAAGLEALVDEDLWVHNGFASRESMEEAHDVLFRVLRRGYEPVGNGDVAGYIMDPNCGNGLLLEKLGELYPQLIGCGIECIRERALAAYQRIDRGEDDEQRIVLGTLGDLDNWRKRMYDLVLMMPGRLLELEPLIRDGVLYYIRHHARKLLVYAYNDQKIYDNLEDYAKAAGLVGSGWRIGLQVDVPGLAKAAIFCCDD